MEPALGPRLGSIGAYGLPSAQVHNLPVHASEQPDSRKIRMREIERLVLPAGMPAVPAMWQPERNQKHLLYRAPRHASVKASGQRTARPGRKIGRAVLGFIFQAL